jgi:hypothetical protein
MKTRALFIICMIGSAACHRLPPQPILTRHQISNDRKPIEKPEETPDQKYGEILSENSFERIARLADLRVYGREIGRALGGDPGLEAQNINLYDEVPDSTWFTNRNAWSSLPLEEISRGSSADRIANEGPLTVVSGKSSGISPGFVVKDSAGRKFLMKFDSTDYCALSTSADVISMRLLHAAGYHVPNNSIAWVDTNRFVRDPKATKKDAYGRKVELKEQKFQEMLARLPECLRDGKLRAMTSEFLGGKIVGPFSFSGRRSDDKNDRIPHQHRRELRALRVFFAWFNNTDWRDYNTLDVFRKTEGEQGHLTHYILDAGGSFGHGSLKPKPTWSGEIYMMDFQDSAFNLLSLGLREPVWRSERPTRFRSVGGFSAEPFHPNDWRPTHPNPAHIAATPRDQFWGARLVASFSDEQIRAAVKAAELDEAGAEDEMVRILAARRDKIAHYWFARVGGLDRFTATTDENPKIQFIDWRTAGPWRPAEKVSYEWTVKGRGIRGKGISKATEISPFESKEKYVDWKAAAEPSKYFELEITPVAERQPELPFGVAPVGAKPIAPATTARFYLDEGRLHWVGLKRSVD